jgi:hypothetical protein
MKNSKSILSFVKFNLILLILLMNSGCATNVLLEKAKGTTSNEPQYDVIHQITSAYLTPDRSLKIYLRGLYEGDPPEQEYSLEIPAKELTINQSVTLSRSQIISGCPARIHSKTWTPVKVGLFSSESETNSLRPLPSTSETIYERREDNNNGEQVVYSSDPRSIVYTSRGPHSTDQRIVIIRTEPVIRQKVVDNNPL